MKKIISLLLSVTILMSVFAFTVQAAVSWPSLSKKSYCEFIAQDDIKVYNSSSLKTRGTSSPYKAYHAYIDEGDICRMIKITSKYIQLQYPTSSGYRTGYVKRADVFSVSQPTKRISSSLVNATTYKVPGGAAYGKTTKGDNVYICGTSGSYTCLIYTAKSGSRAYKMAYIPTSVYNSSFADTINKNTAKESDWQMPMKDYRVNQTFGASGHTGLDIDSDTDKNIYAAADGKVVAIGLNGTGEDASTIEYERGNGYYIVIEHTINGKKVYSMYGHLKKDSVEVYEGKQVNKGEKIAVCGNTGKSYGDHLHFAIADTFKKGSYYGYNSTCKKFSTNSYKESRSKVTFYNPIYVIENNKLP